MSVGGRSGRLASNELMRFSRWLRDGTSRSSSVRLLLSVQFQCKGLCIRFQWRDVGERNVCDSLAFREVLASDVARESTIEAFECNAINERPSPGVAEPERKLLTVDVVDMELEEPVAITEWLE